MEDRGVSVTCVLRGRPCSDKNGVFGVWCPPLTRNLTIFAESDSASDCLSNDATLDPVAPLLPLPLF